MGKRGVIKNDRADEEADDKPHPAVDEKTEGGGGDGRDEDPFVEPDELGELVQVP